MAHLPPRQSSLHSFTALALASPGVRTADKRALEPSADETSSTMGGASLIFSFAGMSSSSMRSWNAAASCLHALLCPRFQSTSWHALEQ
eukprot:CAMPEP_0206807940 /NCGR_PEP_ID=MMETSP0975-20121206/5486_1 /ASSEMBLY_ACC=CAM_ASM_000399 /TAXON_ID=483370 /ORGANISM="non described non described, Strain CCMP2097" /LENGTH=88 /DNA_ID=CAMNT_0054350017 /DNA_START=213 /DNA_END=479 /DNA_ORIENTATION=+